jgi:hypothetical protein
MDGNEHVHGASKLMSHAELLSADSLAGTIYRTMRLYDWPWPWSALSESFGENMVELVAAMAELRLNKSLRKFECEGITFYEIP